MAGLSTGLGVGSSSRADVFSIPRHRTVIVHAVLKKTRLDSEKFLLIISWYNNIIYWLFPIIVACRCDNRTQLVNVEKFTDDHVPFELRGPQSSMIHEPLIILLSFVRHLCLISSLTAWRCVEESLVTTDNNGTLFVTKIICSSWCLICGLIDLSIFSYTDRLDKKSWNTR